MLLCNAVFLVELVDPALCLRLLLLACVERMALGADLDVKAFLRGACNEGIAAVAGNGCLIVGRMNSLSHDKNTSQK